MSWLCKIIGHWNVYEPWRRGRQRYWLRPNACCRCGHLDHWQVSRTTFKPLDVS